MAKSMWMNLTEISPLLHTTDLGRRIVYLTSTDSTMDVARREAEGGAPEGTVVIAEEQTAGRGRFGRQWVSPPGLNLYMTVILRPDIHQLRALALVAPLSVCRLLEASTRIRPLIKWPNDVVVGRRKLAGILIESELSGGNPRYALIGLGLNVNFRPAGTPVADVATSIAQELNKEVSRERVFANTMNHMEELYRRCASGHHVYDLWRARLDTLGREITVNFRGEAFAGVAEDVDPEGNLILRRDDGELMTFEAGEVSLRA
jgi:BirA family biotin operon repressor/biotin-[acetyl-CoA-carboxylase] ligase